MVPAGGERNRNLNLNDVFNQMDSSDAGLSEGLVPPVPLASAEPRVEVGHSK